MNNRYHNLDALRGVAAIAVVVFHLTTMRLNPPEWKDFYHGYYAVDLFFILSGIVVAESYERKLAQGNLSFNDFMKVRVKRLYPLALFGTLLGTIVLLLKYQVAPEKVDSLPRLLGACLSNLFLLPSAVGGEKLRDELFPANGPVWTLYLEILINIVWAAYLVNLRTRFLTFITCMSGLIYFVCILTCKSNPGSDTSTFLVGIPRVTFGFGLGLVFYRIKHIIPSRFTMTNVNHLGLGLSFVFMLWVLNPTASKVFDAVVILLGIPLITFFAYNGKQAVSKIGMFLADLSYPLYITHFPVMALFSGLRQSKFPNLGLELSASILLTVCLLVAWLTLIFVDEPIRKLLKEKVFLSNPNEFLSHH